MTDDLVSLPAPPQKGRRAPFPWLAATVPMVGGVALWAITGSMFSLLFALLGPLIAVASIVDSARAGRRTHRTAATLYARQLTRARERIGAQHARELAQLNAAFPDVLRLIASPPRLWRAMPGDEPPLVLARGERPSICRVTMPDDADFEDPSAEVLALQEQAATLHDAPLTAGMREGVMIRGEEPFARAAARALVLQLCMTHAPGAMTLAALPEQGWEWAEELPHREDEGAPGPGFGATQFGAAALHATSPQPSVSLWVAEAGTTVVGAGSAPGVRIVYGPPTAPVDVRCGALIDLCGADGTAVLSMAELGEAPARAALLGEVQARALTTVLRERAAAMFPQRAAEASPPPFAALLAAVGGGAGPGAGAQHTASAELLRAGGKLSAPFMFAGGEALALDIVADGPHALVAGMTGSGKSELLVSWVTALSALYPPERVVFLLADFKGGTAFAPLAALPHVVGMITDLDDAGASRALESLRAEIRWRETCLAEAGARDIADGLAQMPRLIVVIDEFAALLAQHPALQELFADIAARGRALGIHLILGTQRAAGTVRDALLANIPLRVCLRVVDEADSRAVVGAPGAAGLSAAQPGAALVRRPRDHTPVAARVVLAGPGDRDAAGERWAGHPEPRRPWLPPLPTTLHAADLVREREREVQPALVLGMLDEPAAQRQRAWAFDLFGDRNLLVIGGPGTGRSTLLQMVAHAATTAPVLVDCVQIGDDREHAWDTIEELASGRGARGRGAHTIVLIDDLDALLAGFPGDYAARFGAQIELLLREGMRWGVSVLATVQRMPVAGTRLGDMFNARLVLGLQHRADHLAAGEDTSTFVVGRPPGRGIIRGSEVQVALPPTSYPSDGGRAQAPQWHPPTGLVGVVTRVPALLEAQLQIGWGDDVTVLLLRSLAPGTRLAELAELGRTVVVIGDADAWQQHWSLLAALRAGHPLVIDSGSWAEFRALTGSRELPPYIASDAAWFCAPDGVVARVRLPRPRIHPPAVHGAPVHGTGLPVFGAAAPRAGSGDGAAAPTDPAPAAWAKP